MGLAHAASYVYDANGRLRAVTNSAGASAVYVYDAMGNLLHVDSVAANQLRIFAFSPNHGAVGVGVAISGQGFSTTPANDVVEFNGVLATVTAATPTMLTTTVPVGATTGAITVTVGGQTASSDDVFTVDSTGFSPVVADFTPTIGGMGTAVTVSGSHFDPVPNQTAAAINGRKTNLSSVSDTQVQFAVASTMGSGKVSVTTPYGTGTSSGDFYVTPPGIAAASVTIKERIEVGGSTGSMTIPFGQYAAILFDASAGAWVSFQGTNVSAIDNGVNWLSYKVYDGHNNVIASGSMTSNNPSIHLPQLRVGGTYSIWITPGTATASLTLGLEADPILDTTGTGASIDTTAVSQTKRFVFNAVQNDNLSLALGGIINGMDPTLNIYNSIGRQISPVGSNYHCGSNGCTLSFTGIAAGTYTVIASLSQSGNMAFTAYLSRDIAGTVSLSTPLNLNLPRPGQIAELTFNAQAGDTPELQINNIASSPAGSIINYDVFAPDGNEYTGAVSSASFILLNLQALPQTGTYKIQVLPNNAATFTGQLELTSEPVLAIDGPSQNFATTTPGVSSYLNFTAAAGDHLGLGINGLSITPGAHFTVTVYDPNNYNYAQTDCVVANGGCALDLPNLTAGNYQVIVSPYSNSDTIGFTATLSRHLSGVLSLDTPASVSLRTGQTATFSFSGSSGETVELEAKDVSTSPSNAFVSYAVYNPDGTLYQNYGSGGYMQRNLRNLPQSGTYTVQVIPNYGAALSAQLAFKSEPVLIVDGPQQSFVTTTSGEEVYLNFAASAGDNLDLEISALNLSQGTDVYIDLYDSNNTYVTEVDCKPPGCGADLQRLAGGSYQAIVFFGSRTGTMGFTVSLSNEPTATVGGSSQSFSTTTPGQNIYLNFTASAGENVGVGISGMSESSDNSLSVNIYDSNGSRIGSASCYVPYSTCGIDLQNLAGGNYQMIVSPQSGSDTMGATITLSQDIAETLAANTPTALTLGRYGQTETLTFSATLGQTETLDIGSFTTTPANNAVTYWIFAPDGSQYAAFSASSAYVENLKSLPQSGTYKVYVVPGNGSELSGQVGLIPAVTGTLPVNGSPQTSTTTAGASLSLNFTATAGESIGLGVSNINVSTDGYLEVNIYDSNGNSVASNAGCGEYDSTGTCGLDMPNLAGGNYQAVFSPPGNDTMSFTATLSDDLSGTLQPNVQTATTLPRYGQTARLNFSATAGEVAALTPSNVSTLPVSNGVTYSIYNPDGSYLATFNTSGSGLETLAQAGTYQVYIKPNNGATLSGQLELIPAIMGTLAADGSSHSFSTAIPSQAAYLSFSATQGENVLLAFTNVSVSPDTSVAVTVYNYQNQIISSGNCTVASGCSFTLLSLVAGNYHVTILPPGNDTMSFTVSLGIYKHKGH